MSAFQSYIDYITILIELSCTCIVTWTRTLVVLAIVPRACTNSGEAVLDTSWPILARISGLYGVKVVCD